MVRQIRIEKILSENFKIIEIWLENESHNHSVPKNSETHFKLYLVSAELEGVSRVERQKRILNLLKEEFNQGLHALAMRLVAPSERANLRPEDFISPHCFGKGAR